MFCVHMIDAQNYDFSKKDWDLIFVEFGTVFNKGLKKVGDAFHKKVGSTDYSMPPEVGHKIKVQRPGPVPCLICPKPVLLTSSFMLTTPSQRCLCLVQCPVWLWPALLTYVLHTTSPRVPDLLRLHSSQGLGLYSFFTFRRHGMRMPFAQVS